MLRKSIDDKIQFYKIWLIFREKAFLFNLWRTYEIKSNPKSLPSFLLSKLRCLNMHMKWNENCPNVIALHYCCLSRKLKNARENLQRGFYSRTWRLEFIQVRYFETNNQWKVLIFTGNKQIQRRRTQFCWLRLQKLFNAKSDNTTSACPPNFSTQTNTSTPQMVFLRPKIVQRITDTSAE